MLILKKTHQRILEQRIDWYKTDIQTREDIIQNLLDELEKTRKELNELKKDR